MLFLLCFCFVLFNTMSMNSHYRQHVAVKHRRLFWLTNHFNVFYGNDISKQYLYVNMWRWTDQWLWIGSYFDINIQRRPTIRAKLLHDSGNIGSFVDFWMSWVVAEFSYMYTIKTIVGLPLIIPMCLWMQQFQISAICYILNEMFFNLKHDTNYLSSITFLKS